MSNWNIDPTTRDYVIENGAPVLTTSLTVPAFIRLRTKRTRWLYAPNKEYGSDFYLIQKNHTTQDAGGLEATAARALKPLVDDGRASQIDVNSAVSYRNAAGLEIKILDAQGNPDNLNLNPIG